MTPREVRDRLFWLLVGCFLTIAGLVVLRPEVRPYVVPYFPTLKMWLLAEADHNGVCPAWDAASGPGQVERLYDTRARIKPLLRLAQVDADHRTLWETPQGRYWLPEGADDEFMTTLVTEQALDIYTYGKYGVRQGDVVLDCGANVGIFTRQALNKGAKLVVAIEPSPENLECLRRNFASEIAAGHVEIVGKGVWDREQTLFLEILRRTNPGMDAITLHSPGHRPGVWVPLTTIDKLVDELKLPRVDFIKMDIEGAEARAVAGASATMAKYKPRMAIATEHTDDKVRNSASVVQTAKRAQPAYVINCGFCITDRNNRPYPDEVYFH